MLCRRSSLPPSANVERLLRAFLAVSLLALAFLMLAEVRL